MSRHVVDTPKTREKASRLREFVRVERENAPNPASAALHARPQGPRSGAKMRRFLEIEREGEA